MVADIQSSSRPKGWFKVHAKISIIALTPLPSPQSHNDFKIVWKCPLSVSPGLVKNHSLLKTIANSRLVLTCR
jgi:hypothetical protein